MSTIGVGGVGAGWARTAGGALIAASSGEAIVLAALSPFAKTVESAASGRCASRKAGRSPVFHSAADAVAITISASPAPAINPERYEDRPREYWLGGLSVSSGQRS